MRRLVSQLGSVGYLIGAAGITFPGEIAKGVSFASVNSDGVYNAWAKVPEEGKLQILCLLLALETANESKKPHYMRGGVPGRIDSLPFDRAAGTSGLWAPKIKFWDPLGFTGALSAEQKARKRKAELKNGRLAMIAVLGELMAQQVSGYGTYEQLGLIVKSLPLPL